MSSPGAPKAAARTDPLIGTLLAGKYKILKKIGEGGMGSVYIADQEPINRKVAVKVLLGKLAEDEVAVKRFEQEAKAISRMQHPNTVTIYDFGTEESRLYIVMEYLKGKTLTQVLRHEGVIAAPRACKIMRQVCASLADAHAAGIIHRDLKPDNIFLTEVGGDPDWVKVLDFGVAKLADAEGAGTLTQTGMIFGTPKYMSPEQAEGRPIDYRADIYALGVVMYELLVGRPPFVADTPVGLLLKHISEPPPAFSRVRPDLNIDPRVEAIVFRALEKHPDRRQPSVGELAHELQGFERMITGPNPIMTAHVSGGVPMTPGLPTEVVPGQPGAPSAGLTPSGLAPPNQVPSGMSLGVQPQTRGLNAATGVATAQQGVPTGAATAQGMPLGTMATAPQGVMPFAQGTAPLGAAPVLTHGLTAPIPAPGGTVDTLGGIPGEISTGLRPPPKPKTGLLYGGGALLVLSIGVFVFALKSRETRIESAPADPTEARATAEPPAKPPVADPPAPVADPPRPAEEQSANEPKVSERPKTPVRPAPVREPAAPSRTVSVRFESTPPGARVEFEGRQLGVTPFTTDLPRGSVETFDLRLAGYETAQQLVSASDDKKVHVELKKLAEAPKEAPRESKEPKEPTPPAAGRTPKPEKKPPPNTSVLDEKIEDLKIE